MVFAQAQVPQLLQGFTASEFPQDGPMSDLDLRISNLKRL
jgi:hypothetical protein